MQLPAGQTLSCKSWHVRALPLCACWRRDARLFLSTCYQRISEARYKNKTISPESFQVGVYHHSFSPGGSEEQRHRKHRTKGTGKFRMESEHSGLCALSSVSVAIRKKQLPVFTVLNQTGKQCILSSLLSPVLKPSRSLILRNTFQRGSQSFFP